MNIPTVYLLFAAEFMLLLIGLILFLIFYVYKQSSKHKVTEQTEDNETSVNPGSSYIEFLEKELLRNEAKSGQQTRIEKEDTEENAPADTEAADAQTSESTDKKHSRLLDARNMFLNVEKDAAAHSENEHAFWDSIYAGMKQLLDTFKTIDVEKEVVVEQSVEHKQKTTEKVFYIETQGKKVDGEVNKLKDIIYEQENTLSSLKKSLMDSATVFKEDSQELTELHTQINSFERQLSDSKMCMEVLEMENERLQQEVRQLESRAGQASDATDKATGGSASTIDLQQMKEVIDKQNQQIAELHQTIEGLELEADQSEKLTATINDFARTSKDMMGCITILEEENEHLKEQLHDIEAHVEPGATNDAESADDKQTDTLKSQIKSLQEELIKKDVNYARLQDEFSSMEKEYLAMYEAMHGDKS